MANRHAPLDETPPLRGRREMLAALPKSAQEPDELAPGYRLGSFVVDEARYRGGFALVYRAHHVESGLPAALKVLHRHLAASPSILERFEREAHMLNALRHPHIVEVLETGALEGGRPYLAMEWLEGRTLAQELTSRGPLSLPEVLAVLEELGSALAAAHGLGIVHRDFKAQNVVVLPRENWFMTKLVDFGIAKLTGAGVEHGQVTTSGLVMGTPLTMAPEQILGQEVDARTDIYAMGILLFQMATGRLPFQGPTYIEIEDMHLHAPPPRPSELVPVPPEFDAVVRRCLEKERLRRYPGVAELLEDLRRVALVGQAQGTASQVEAVALHVEALLPQDIDDAPEPVLDDVEAILATARAAATQGLAVAMESGNAVLLCELLGTMPTARQAGRQRVLKAARELQVALAAREGARSEVTVRVAVLAGVVPHKSAITGIAAAGAALLTRCERIFESEVALDHPACVPARRTPSP
ncbi:MAG: serine/threonine protein kinase [Deltaproteobacteria bacterium]|nr:serine/threonine protein kinase [Deltaproteobacteria bacterium]